MGKGRAPCCDKNQVKRGPWSPAEDLRLMTFIQKYGHENWRSLPKQAGLLRCGKSCRLRWINYLRPDVKRGNFTQEEEDSIIRLHRELGNKWSKIASHLPGRTDNEIKNVWNTHLKKRVLSSSSLTNKKNGDLSSPTSSSSSSSFSTTTTSSVKRNQAAIDTSDKQRKRQRTLVDEDEEEDEEDEEVVNKEDGLNNNHYASKSSSTKEISGSSGSSSLIDNVVTMDSIFSMGESVGNVYDVLEDVSRRPGDDEDQFSLQIPLESDMEFWDLLDGVLMDDQPTGNEVGNVNVACLSDEHQLGVQSSFDDGEGGEDKQKWLRYLETELGLEENNNETNNQDDMAIVLPQVPREENGGQTEENLTSPSEGNITPDV